VANPALIVPLNSVEKLLQLKDQSVSYFLSLWDKQSGGFRFAPHQSATLMATSYCVLGLEFTQGLDRLSDEQKTNIISFLMAGVQPDGSFCDPLFRTEDIISKEHNLAYFQEETTTICQQALDALSAPPPPPRDWLHDKRTLDGVVSYLESLSWQNPWMDSNPVMFLLSQLCHDVERNQKPELLAFVDTALDWLDAHQSSQTGLWKGSHPVSSLNAMAATFHFTFYYGYRHRPIQYTERIIDSCLSLQERHGLFGGNAIGQTCLDYDGIDLLAKASLVTDYRSEDVQKAMVKAYSALLELHNPADGGFANCKEFLNFPREGRKAKLLKKLGLGKFLPSPTRMPSKGTYHVCWRLLSCETSHSNAFSTWFRLLALHLATQQDWLNANCDRGFTFRRLPFLGYHNWEVALSSQPSNSLVTSKS
jgi:hypothetical protein